MKKTLSLLLALVMALTLAFSAVSLAEELTEAQQAEMAKVMSWLMEGIPENEYTQIFSWDRDTILKKLEGYGQPLETITKEEIADQLLPVFSMFSLFTSAADSENGGEAVLGLVSGLLGGEGLDEGFIEWEDEEDYDDGPDIDWNFDGPYWVSGNMILQSVWMDDYTYKVFIRDGETELAYLCKMDPETRINTSSGTGDPELTEAQPDHGVAVFFVNDEGQMVWQKADGTAVLFEQHRDPLDLTSWYNGKKSMFIVNYDFDKYQVTVYEEPFFWVYECVLDEEADALKGTGYKGWEDAENALYEDAQGTFTFLNGRTQAVWTDDKEPETLNGVTFEAVERRIVDEMWSVDDGGFFAYMVDAYYNVQVYYGYDQYGYLCTYDRASGTLTAVDPATIDFDSIAYDLEKEIYTTTASFVLQDDDHLLWRDDSGVTGENGIVFDRVVF